MCINENYRAMLKCNCHISALKFIDVNLKGELSSAIQDRRLNLLSQWASFIYFFVKNLLINKLASFHHFVYRYYTIGHPISIVKTYDSLFILYLRMWCCPIRVKHYSEKGWNNCFFP